MQNFSYLPKWWKLLSRSLQLPSRFCWNQLFNRFPLSQICNFFHFFKYLSWFQVISCQDEFFGNSLWLTTQAGKSASGFCNSGFYSPSPVRNCIQSGFSAIWGPVTNPCQRTFPFPFPFPFLFASLQPTRNSISRDHV